MNGRILTIPRRMSPIWATQTRRATEERLHRSRAAIARSARLLADHHLHEVRGLASLHAPRRAPTTPDAPHP